MGCSTLDRPTDDAQGKFTDAATHADKVSTPSAKAGVGEASANRASTSARPVAVAVWTRRSWSSDDMRMVFLVDKCLSVGCPLAVDRPIMGTMPAISNEVIGV